MSFNPKCNFNGFSKCLSVSQLTHSLVIKKSVSAAITTSAGATPLSVLSFGGEGE